jgi:two-component system response regulator HydG
MSAGSILVVEDERSAAEYLRLLLEDKGFAVELAANGVEALLALERRPPSLVLSDLRMPEMDGLELVAHVHQRWPEVPVILITADSDVSLVVEAVQHGAWNYLVKPAPPAAVLAAVEKALAARRAGPGGGVREIPELVGRSKALVEVRHLVALAARSDVHVLITGDTGTGKELVARAIHRYSGLRDGPFVAHNCALVPRDLFESEFFGHRRGSFTGADRDHVGLLTRADGGVLFLDELETLALDHQAKLLRVIDDGEVRAVGSEQARRVSVRFLAATNRDAERMIAENELRRDLYYRLRGFEIRLPRLEDRREDIPLLADHFLGADAPGFTPEAMEALRRARWPGNVRQLRNTIAAARAAAGGAPIGVRHLALDAPPAVLEPTPAGSAAPPGATLREIERHAILQALRDCDHNRTRAAQQLGIDRSTLRRKIQEFGLEDA